MNTTIVGLYWYSHIMDQDMSLLFLNINMPDDLYVMYFANNIADSLFLTIPICCSIFIITLLVYKENELFKDAVPLPDRSWIKKMFHNELKSFLLPIKHGRMNVIITSLLLVSLIFIIFYAYIPTVYMKLYNEAFYRELFNSQVQSDHRLGIWALKAVLIYHITTIATLAGVKMTCVTLFYKKTMKTMMEKG